MTDRFRVAHSDINYGMPRQYQRLKEHCVWDTKECRPVGFFEYWGEAMHICSLLNELNNKTHKEKPKPLKQQIIDIIEDVDKDKFDMKNKIIKQKEHIKDLETKIKHLKNDVKNNQRSIDRLTRQDIENNNKYMCRVEEIDRLKCCNRELKREKEEYRKRFIKIQEEINRTYIPVPSKFNKIKRIMEGYYD